MKIKPKIMLGSTAIALLAVLITTIGITLIVNKLITASLQNEVQNRLISQRDLKKDQIEQYLKRVNDEVQESATLNGTFSKALLDFSRSFTQFSSSQQNKAQDQTINATDKTLVLESHKQALESYYYQQFSEKFIQKNEGIKPTDVEEILANADENTLALQYAYIADNPEPLGDKDKLVTLKNSYSNYANTHKKYHPLIKAYKEKWGFYDVFLVDAKTGYIVYSVEKELDYATSLRTGYYANSGLGEAFKQALDDNQQSKTYTSKMQPYYPSYNDFASFVSSPLYVNGVLTGVFIIQMPLDNINNIMTFNQQWQKYGLGESGETYLVAADNTMRNNSRFLLEDPNGYFSALKKAGIDARTVNTIAKKETSIGLQPVDTAGSKAAMAGETGFAIFPDYRDIPVLSAYTPLNIQGLNWVLLAEIDQSEAFAAITMIKQKIINAALLIGAVLIALSILGSLLFANKLVAPIIYFNNVMQRFDAGDKNARISTQQHDDEIAELATVFNKLLDEHAKTLQSVIHENETLNESIIEMLYISSELSKGDLTAKMTVNEDVTGTLADSLNLVIEQTGKTLNQVKETASNVDTTSKTVQQQSNTILDVSEKESVIISKTAKELNNSSTALHHIAQLAKQCNQAANDTIVATDSAKESVSASVAGINAIKEEMSETEKRIKRLSERSQAITSVTHIIQSIAERTNVLALNATMHATAAGDAGRGFAGVANEIKRLAENASEATHKIDALVKNIQMDTNDTIKTMNTAITQVAEGNKIAQHANTQIVATRDKSYELAKLVQTIADHSIDQADISTKLQQQATKIQQSHTETAKQLQQQKVQTNKLVDYAQNLSKSIDAFKTH